MQKLNFMLYVCGLAFLGVANVSAQSAPAEIPQTHIGSFAGFQLAAEAGLLGEKTYVLPADQDLQSLHQTAASPGGTTWEPDQLREYFEALQLDAAVALSSTQSVGGSAVLDNGAAVSWYYAGSQSGVRIPDSLFERPLPEYCHIMCGVPGCPLCEE